MRYLTKEWYRLCALTDLHSDLTIHAQALEKNDLFFETVYAEKEAGHIEMEKEVYDTDPRFMLEGASSPHLSLKALFHDLALESDDIFIPQLSDKERSAIDEQIAAFDKRPPFDPVPARGGFCEQFERRLVELAGNLPFDILARIADQRVYALGFCSREVYGLVKDLSEANEAEVVRRLEAFEKAQMNEDLAPELAENFGAHDAKVLDLEIAGDVTLTLDPEGSFSEFSEIRFTKAEILKLEGPIVQSYWIYNELYRVNDQYEAHILFSGGEVDDLAELIVRSDDIVMK